LLSFNAKAILLKKDTKNENNWVSEYVRLQNVDDIKNIFQPHQSEMEEIYLSDKVRVYYSIGFLEGGVDVRVNDSKNDYHYASSPLLLVECDNTKPVDITEDTYKQIIDKIFKEVGGLDIKSIQSAWGS
jgi:hypothetical protein